MIVTNEVESDKPWYKEPWLWFVLSPMILVVFASIFTVSIAVIKADDVVSDNYYKEGRALAQNTSSDAYAKSLGLDGELLFDLVSGEVILDINQNSEAKVLSLLISHPAEAERDQTLDLKKISDRRFRAGLSSALGGRWYLRLTAYENLSSSNAELWRLHGEIDFTKSARVTLE